MLVQRLGGAMQLDEKYVDGIISANKKYEGSFDEVWLTTSYGFPPLDVHKDYASKLEKVAQKFRDNGIKVSMQLANSIGHGSYIAHSCDCSALLEGEYKTQSLIGPGGEDGYVCFCWNSETFRSYLYQEIEAYCSKVKPDILWIDEAQSITKTTLDIIVPTIRKKNSAIIFTMNRYTRFDAVYNFCAKRDDCRSL